VKVTKRSKLRDELSNRATGGIYFTTLQKFGLTKQERDIGADHPLLTDRRNIIVIVDEAHRSHYDDLDGYARHIRDALPNAMFIAFTGTPISEADRNTREVFGPNIDVYDLTRAVNDEATVPVYFEPRLAKVGWSEDFSEDDLDNAGVITVVYSGSPQDQGLIAKHVRREGQNKIIPSGCVTPMTSCRS
jgi:type I restriction enzyme R subunit